MNANVNVKKKKPGRGRKRRLAGWTLMALGLLVAGVIGTSHIWEFVWKRPPWMVMVSRGEVGATFEEWAPAPDLSRYTEFTRVDRHGGLISWHIVQSGGRRAQMYPGTSVRDTWPLRWVLVPGRHKVWSFDLVAVLVPLLATAAALLVADHRRRRQARTGQCRKCGYSLAGLAVGGGGAVCPECGKK